MITSDTLSGTTALEHDLDFHLAQYLKTRGLLRDDALQPYGRKELRCNTDEQLWRYIFKSKKIFETQRIFLEEFAILDWVPQSPGLYHTQDAKRSRREAAHYIVDRFEGSVVFDPYGKTRMIRGGVGCLRLAMKNIGGHDLKFLCASKTGIAHRGFIIAMPSYMYSKIAHLINKSGAIIANIVGELRCWPPDPEMSLYYHQEIPRFYLLVEDVRVHSQNSRFGQLDVTAAVTFKGRVDGVDGKYFTYSHFDPARNNSLHDCVNWMRKNYVEERYHGKVLTDFDELISHFPDSYFPVKVLMNPQVSTSDISDIILKRFNIKHDSIIIKQLNIEGGVMSNVTINGDGNVIGNHNQIVTTINKGLTSSDMYEIGVAFALLKGEIIQLQNSPERIRNRAIRAVQDAEDEAAHRDGDKNTIVDSLKRAKAVLEESGETYDKAKSWGKRLFDLGNTIASYYPAIKALITWL